MNSKCIWCSKWTTSTSCIPHKFNYMDINICVLHSMSMDILACSLWNKRKDDLTQHILWQHLYIKFHLVSSYMFVIVWYTSVLPCKTNPCRKMNSNYKRCSQLLMNSINPEHPTQVQQRGQDQHHHQGMSFHLREALPEDMGQSSSTRCGYIKMLKRKMATPFWA